MNSEQNTWLRRVAKKILVAIRARWRFKPQFTIFEIAHRTGLPIEYLDNMPVKFDAWLDPHETPRFISVNRNLSQDEKVFAVTRELGFYAQQQRRDSLILNRPWKWAMLDAAPEPLKHKISTLDAEFRGHWLMFYFATGDEFRAYVKRHPKKVLAIGFAGHVAGFHLYVLRIKMWVRNFVPAFVIS